MRLIICVVAAMAAALATAGDAFADASAGQGYFTVMGSYIDDDKDRQIDDGINGGQFGFGRALSDSVNFEAFYMAGRGEGNPDLSFSGIGIDLQFVMMRDERFSPYIFGGAGYLQVDPVGASDDESAMLSGGLGFYIDLFSTNVALRGEFRRRTAVTSGNLTDNLFSVGVHLPFGSGKPKWVDSDGDGVGDSMDRCPNTPAGAPVDAFGCELDSDGDGVKDSKDRCPNTPRGIGVDASGCPLDSDGDGVTDDKDECPRTPRGAKVDAKGCELDSDGDGVVDRLDECPGTPEGTPVDNRGCELEGEYVLEGVNFETNSDRLRPGATDILDEVVATLKRYPNIRFEVAGHTDSDGSAAYNEGLSARRAQTVHDYLAANGISVERMSVRGYGESRPIADNATSAGKAQNRRVSLNVIED